MIASRRRLKFVEVGGPAGQKLSLLRQTLAAAARGSDAALVPRVPRSSRRSNVRCWRGADTAVGIAATRAPTSAARRLAHSTPTTVASAASARFCRASDAPWNAVSAAFSESRCNGSCTPTPHRQTTTSYRDCRSGRIISSRSPLSRRPQDVPRPGPPAVREYSFDDVYRHFL